MFHSLLFPEATEEEPQMALDHSHRQSLPEDSQSQSQPQPQQINNKLVGDKSHSTRSKEEIQKSNKVQTDKNTDQIRIMIISDQKSKKISN